MTQLTDTGLETATGNELLDLLHAIDDDPTAVEDDLAGKIVSKILRKALARLGLHDAVSVVFEVDDGGGFHFGVGVSSVKDASGAEIALSPETTDALNRTMVGPYAVLAERRRSR